MTGAATSLAKDPQPSVDRIDELARRILIGDILLPKFQRDFIWDRKQVIALLDSVARGYPIGSILLWQSRQELRSENRIADLEIKLPKPDYPVNYLLDGQQRLSTICGALYWKGGDPKSIWNLAYDLRHLHFVHLESLDDPPPHLVRVNKLADAAAFFKHVSSLDTLMADDRAALKANAEAFFNRFKDYKIATVTLGDMSLKDVAPIFERINSEGTRLTIVDLMRAATWSQDFDLVDSIDAILDELSEKDFSAIDRKVVLRSVSATAGGGFSTESIDDLRNKPALQLQGAVDETSAAYRRCVDFLVTEIRIPDARVLPYMNQMTVLVEAFRLLPKPTSEQYKAIKRWFWRTSFTGYFGGWNTGAMARDQAAVKQFAAGASNDIDFGYTPPNYSIWKSRAFRANNAHTKTFAIVLCHQSPIDLLTGQKIDVTKALAWENSKEFHHFFPQKFLATKKEPPTRIGLLANIVLLTSASNKVISDTAPSVYLKAVEKAAGADLDRWLSANLISPEAFKAAQSDDYDGFLDARSHAIQQAVTAAAG